MKFLEIQLIFFVLDMRAALEAFRDAGAWGPYDTSTHAKLLYAAGWPRTVRPYAVRGTFGMELSKRGADLADIQQLMGHRDQKTTRVYYVPPEQSRLAAASRSVGRRFGWKRLHRNVYRLPVRKALAALEQVPVFHWRRSKT